MMTDAPLQITVEIRLEDGPAAGERRFRLSRQLHLPPALSFAGELPLEGEGLARLTFQLPDGTSLRDTWARLRCDPDHPERGSRAELLDLRPEAVAAFQSYLERCEETA